ncbi:sensor histidine kinase [Undibacterium sp. YM2]|uniref:sensor histidine kinase n=1 Tax=Undibacterium sp. YM2 TaxID=2058625 RepID=UPI001E302897|nr:histidine kinase [Undibacterium sp. YM2]
MAGHQQPGGAIMDGLVYWNKIKKPVFTGWFLFWLLMVAVAVQDHLKGGGKHIWEPIFWESSSALVGTLLLLLQRRKLTDRHLLQTPARWFWQQILPLPLFSTVFVVLVYSLRHSVYALLGLSYQHDGWIKVYFYECSKIFMFFGMFYVVIFGLQAYASLLEEKENAEKSQALLRDAQLHRLTQQMQPHFLFNVLNTISSLMYTDVKLADTALSEIAALLRASMDLGQHSETSLADELKLLQAYAKLMSLRFIDRVEINWDIADDVLSSKVPVMSLQTILENSFKHTVEKRSQLTHIKITAYKEAAQVILRIEDDAGHLQDSVQSSGVGISNLRQRLQVLYQDKASLQLTDLRPSGVMTELRLPIDTGGMAT